MTDQPEQTPAPAPQTSETFATTSGCSLTQLSSAFKSADETPKGCGRTTPCPGCTKRAAAAQTPPAP